MMSILDELEDGSGKSTTPGVSGSASDIDLSHSLSISQAAPATQLLFFNKLNVHTPEAGINPLVDAAAYLFFLMGKLQRMRGKQDLADLHRELVSQIQQYQDAIYTCHYNQQLISEYIPAATYAMCFTFDDIIMDAQWGGITDWQEYSLVTTFFSEPPSKKSFMIILERLVMDAKNYIDAIELMYICLSFGFKNKNILGGNVFEYDEADEIATALYRRIVAYRGQATKTLAPYPIRPKKATVNEEVHPDAWQSPDWQTVVAVCSVIVMLGISGIGYLKTYVKTEAASNATFVAEVKKNITDKQLVEVALND